METDKNYQRLLQKIAANIKFFREKRELTQEDMRDHGFNHRHYQRLESGKHSPALYTLYRLTKIFDAKLDDFLK